MSITGLRAAAAMVALSIARLAAADAIIIDRTPTGSVCCLDGASTSPRGPFVLAGSFVFEGTSGTLMRTVGAYLQRNGDGNPDIGSPGAGTGTQFGFEVSNDQTLRSCLLQPDEDVCSFVFESAPSAATNDASHFPGLDYLPSETLSLSLVTASLDVPIPLINGSRYWILVSTFFTPSQGSYQVGQRVGTGGLAASFDPSLTTFYSASDLGKLGLDIDPLLDLAIYASGTEPVPEPAPIAMLATGVLVLTWRRYRAGRRTQNK